MTKGKNVFTALNAVNVNQYTEKKGRLTYLSWSNAWGELMKLYPDSSFRVYENKDGHPYFADQTGVMVKVSVTVQKVERICWLPVMDNRNNSKKIEQTTTRDINDTIMRCLAKAIALHGLGLYIYQGEDLPKDVSTEAESDESKQPEQKPSKTNVIPIKSEPKKEESDNREKINLGSKNFQGMLTWVNDAENNNVTKESRIVQLDGKFNLSNDAYNTLWGDDALWNRRGQ